MEAYAVISLEISQPDLCSGKERPVKNSKRSGGMSEISSLSRSQDTIASFLLPSKS